ncbi:MAG: universal stress protein [Chitinophagaceae bacterium]
MPYAFKSILVPVDFTINTEVAVKKALCFADAGAVIHLLHVQTGMFLGSSLVSVGLWTDTDGEENSGVLQTKLQQWKTSIEESPNDISVCSWISTDDSVQEVIEKKAAGLNVDLIVIGKNSHHSWIPFLNTVAPARLAKNTGKAVLTVKPGSIHNNARSIVVPAATDTCDQKMELIAAICRKFRITVHLVTFIDDSPEFSSSSLLRMYQGLRNNLQCEVDYTVLHGTNKPRAVLDYAEKIGADILLLKPVSETKIGWLNRHISDVLLPESKLEVLTV